MYLILQLCEMFHCLPSQLMKEDASVLYRLYYLKIAEQQYYEGKSKK